MRNFKRLLSFAKPYSKYWPQYAACTLLGSIFGAFNFILVIPLLDVIFNPDTGLVIKPMPALSWELVSFLKGAFEHALSVVVSQYGRFGALLFVSGMLIVASLITNLLRYLGQKVLARLRTDVVANLRGALFSKIVALPIRFFNKQRKGNLLSVLSNDINETQASVVQSFQTILRDPFLIVMNLGILFYMSYQLTLISLVALPVSGYLIGLLTKRLRRQATTSQQLLGELLSVVEEVISGARIIKAFNGQQYISRKFTTLNNKQSHTLKRIYYRQELASPVSEFLGITIAAGILLVGGWFIIHDRSEFTISSFIGYLVFYYQILVPLKNTSSAYTSIQRGMASANRIFEVLDTEIEINEPQYPVRIDEVKEGVEFHNVSFAYDTEPVLRNVNLTIPKGKMYALVGASGAGKTTMADLLPRFYDVTEGSIRIDGKDIRDYKQEDLLNLMGIVTQEAILFNDTVRNNIAFGMENVELDDIVAAARIANAHGFIQSMELGYDTNIGDRGTRLSGGQRQRLAIARAVLKNPPILILDEATSALDTESEKLVQDALTKLMQNRTSIVIAHRLSTIKDADSIVVMQDGRIVEQGTHDELIQKEGGVYKNLCSLQAFK